MVGALFVIAGFSLLLNIYLCFRVHTADWLIGKQGDTLKDAGEEIEALNVEAKRQHAIIDRYLATLRDIANAGDEGAQMKAQEALKT